MKGLAGTFGELIFESLYQGFKDGVFDYVKYDVLYPVIDKLKNKITQEMGDDEEQTTKADTE